MGHYEPVKEVINLTKVKGSLGILAHEWAHALDHHLYRISSSDSANKVGMLSDLQTSHNESDLMKKMRLLVETMKDGTSIQYVETDTSDRYRLNELVKIAYRKSNGDALTFMNLVLEERRSHLQYSYPKVSKPQSEIDKRIAKMMKRDIEAYAVIFKQLHEANTGESVLRVPYPSNTTAFYSNSLKADKGKDGKYWSSNTEMFARAFEYTVQRHLEENGLESDYLVCGAEGHIYPEKQEGDIIYRNMVSFIEDIRHLLLFPNPEQSDILKS